MDIIEHAKEIAELIKKYNDQDLYQRIVDLRDEIFELREETQQLKEHIKQLENEEDISKEIYRDGNAYFRNHKDGTKSGPYCLTCWDGDRKLVNLLELGYGAKQCGRCSRKK
jgi:ribosomal protein L29